MAVLRALEAREGTGELAAGLREVRRPAPAGASGPPGGRARAALATPGGGRARRRGRGGGGGAAAGAVGDRGTGQMITGQATPAPPPRRARVRHRSRAWSGACASTQATSPPTSPSPRATWTPGGSGKPPWSTWACCAPPGNVEAKTQLGLLLFRAGLPEPGSARSSRPWPPTHATRRPCTPRASSCSWGCANPRPRSRAFAPTSRWPPSGRTATWSSSSSSWPPPPAPGHRGSTRPQADRSGVTASGRGPARRLSPTG